MAQKTVFLEKAFWDKFSECSRDLMSSSEFGGIVEKMEKISKLYDIYKFISRSSVFVDCPLDVLAAQSKNNNDDMLQMLLQSSGDGEMNLDYQEDSMPDLETHHPLKYDDDYSAVFMTAVNHAKAARRHGVLNISPETLFNQRNKFKDTGKAVKRNNEWTWRTMEILKENSNAMVIVDNFILKPDKNSGKYKIDYNLEEIFRLMLPDSYNEEYTLSIFYNDDDEKEKEELGELKANKRREGRRKEFYDSIMKFVGKEKKQLSFNLELFPTKADIFRQKEFHDRTVITNNVWVGSGAGFDLLFRDYSARTNARAKRTTTTHGIYLGFGSDAVEWLDNGYDNLIADVRKSLSDNKYKSNNRLLAV